jgi:hypothetical protein
MEDKHGRDSLQEEEDHKKNTWRVGLPSALAPYHEIQMMTTLQAVPFHKNSRQEEQGGVGGRKDEVVESTSKAHDEDDRSGWYSRKKVLMQHNLNENNSSGSHAPKDRLLNVL